MEASHKHTKNQNIFRFALGLESCVAWQGRYNCIHFWVWRGKRNAKNLLAILRPAACGKTALNTWRTWGDNAELIFRTSFFLWNQSWVEAFRERAVFYYFGKRKEEIFLLAFFVSQANYTYNSWRGCGAIRGHWLSWTVSPPQACARSPTAWSTWNSPTRKQQNLLRLPEMKL